MSHLWLWHVTHRLDMNLIPLTANRLRIIFHDTASRSIKSYFPWTASDDKLSSLKDTSCTTSHCVLFRRVILAGRGERCWPIRIIRRFFIRKFFIVRKNIFISVNFCTYQQICFLQIDILFVLSSFKLLCTILYFYSFVRSNFNFWHFINFNFQFQF